MSVLLCPVCGEKFNIESNCLKCPNNHSFDVAKEGYVNLFLTSKSGDKIGDSKESAHARHTLLAKGYYSCLKDYLKPLFKGTVLDICCGDGYYDDYNGALYGFDISKEMVRLAAKGNKNGKYFVANLASIPIEDKSIDTAIHLFAPFNENEFERVLKPGGKLYTVVGGENHLWQLKQLLYDTPYKNDEQAPRCESLRLVSKNKISNTVKINEQDLKTLFSMTPYFYRTSRQNKERLNGAGDIELTVEFVIFEYERTV